jgi:hypothetical protein
LKHSIAHVHAFMPRTAWMKKVDGGVSAITRHILRGMFLGEQSVSRAGIMLPIGAASSPIKVKIDFQALLGDEEALNAMWHSKGASGICPCALLCSVTNKQRPQDLADGVLAMTDIDPLLADISCPDLELCGLRSNEEVWHLCNLLEVCSKEALAEQEHISGLKLNPHSLLFDRELRAFVEPSSTTFDPMHVIFSNGILCSEIMKFMNELKRHVGAYFADVRSFVQEFGWKPKTELFNETRENNSHDSLKCGASELLSGYPLLRAFVVATYGVDAPEPYVVSIMLLFRICDEHHKLIRGLSGIEVEAIVQRLQLLCQAYLVAFVKAYGREAVRYKHHQLLHMALQILRNTRQLACWVTERKNIKAKEALQHNKNIGDISGTGLSRMLNAQVRLLENPGWATDLGRAQSFPELAVELSAQRVHISAQMSWNGTQLVNKDIMFLGVDRTYMVVIVACLSIDESCGVTKFGLLVRTCKRLSGTEFQSVWHVDSQISIYRLVSERVFQVRFHRYLACDQVEVLL